MRIQPFFLNYFISIQLGLPFGNRAFINRLTPVAIKAYFIDSS